MTWVPWASATDDASHPAVGLGSSCSLGERDVHVWTVPLAPGAGDEDAIGDMLSVEERATMARLSSTAGRRRYGRSHAAVRVIVGGYLGRDPRRVSFRRDPLGKPQVAGGDLRYSLSHAGDVALVGVGRGRPLGVDVEPVRRLVEREALVRRCFTARERAHLDALGTDEDILRLWVRKEAVAKATGEGLERVFEGLDVLSARALPGWRIEDLVTAPGHVAAAAVRDDVARLVVARFEPSRSSGRP
jgi:4'-phosphopantetheinyl transferase